MLFPEWRDCYLQVGSCFCFGCTSFNFGKNSLNISRFTQVVHDVDWGLHGFWDGEGVVANVFEGTATVPRIVVLQAHLFDFADFNVEEDADSQKDEEEGEETDGGLVEGDFFQFSVHE